MTIETIITNLEYFNDWRTGLKIAMPDPNAMTRTINEAIKQLKKQIENDLKTEMGEEQPRKSQGIK